MLLSLADALFLLNFLAASYEDLRSRSVPALLLLSLGGLSLLSSAGRGRLPSLTACCSFLLLWGALLFLVYLLEKGSGQLLLGGADLLLPLLLFPCLGGGKSLLLLPLSFLLAFPSALILLLLGFRRSRLPLIPFVLLSYFWLQSTML